MADVRRMGLDQVVRQFQDLEDPRSTVNRLHPLASVLVIALLACSPAPAGPLPSPPGPPPSKTSSLGCSICPTASPARMSSDESS
jgi:hypothetical protein